MINKYLDYYLFEKKHIFLYTLILIFADIFALSAAAVLSYYLRFYTKIFSDILFANTINKTYLASVIIFIAGALVIIALFGLYRPNRIYLRPTYYFRILISVIVASLLFVIFWIIFVDFLFSRIWFALFFSFSVLFIVTIRGIIAVISREKLKEKKGDVSNYYFGIGENLKIAKEFSRLKKKIIYGIFLFVNDVVFLGFSFYYAYYLRFYTRLFGENELSFTLDEKYVLYSIIFILLAVFIFLISKLYNWDNIYRGSNYAYRIVRSLVINIVIIILMGTLFNRYTFSRIWLLLLIVFSIISVLISRLLIEYFTQLILNKIGINGKTAIVGIGENGKRIEDTFERRSFWGYKIAGYIDHKDRIEKHHDYAKSFNILGYAEDIKGVVLKNNIQRVIISGLEYKYFEVLDIIEKLKGLDLSIMLFPGFFEFSIKRLAVREISGIPLMQVANIGFFGFNLFLKNFIDYFLGIIFFILFIPIYLVVGLFIKIDSKGPIFYKQKRYTKKCKEFYIYKFRTMYVDADKRLEELKKFNEASGPLFKMKNDPRVTRVGRFLRKFSIDEVPQIINVLRGELSIVGPRPPIPAEVEEYAEWQLKRLDVKQGITGLWQISGRSDLNFEEMTRLDLYYIQNWSIGMDLIIILKTIPAVIFRKGAY